MALWVIFPVSLSLISFVGTWSVYGIALSHNHVCSLSDWSNENYCRGNHTTGCCSAPTISTSGKNAPENSLFSATINAGAFMFLLFCLFHHAHILERHSAQMVLSKLALLFGVVAAMGAFAAGNCNPGYLALLHNFGAAVSFTGICFYTVLLTSLTRKCALTGYEKLLYPLRIISTIIQAIVTICYTVLYVQNDFFCVHLSAVFEWVLSVNLQLFELSYSVEFCFFSSYMISNLLTERDEEKPLMMTLT